ncbi:MAG: NADH-quinone oxidoreductase subunit A [Pseudomonadota bacterium]
MLVQYLPIGVFILVGIGIGLIPIALGRLLAPHRPNSEKLSPYECGFAPFEDARLRFDVRFYLVAVLFILFDLELAFIIPWAVVLDKISGAALLAMVAFLLLLFVGFVYEWRKGALEWE